IVAAASVSAETIQVAVGQNGLTFSPNNITAAVGDSVEFSFFPKNHSVTQSSFTAPCHPLANGFFSTFQPTTSESANTFTILVNDTKPIWLYCGQTTGNHCQSGMVASINAPTTGNTLAAFTLLAKNATTPSTSPPGGVAGGILKVSSSNSNSTSDSSSSSSSVAEKTVTASITTTVTSLVTSGGSSYTTTYGTT
ncbi:Cupredoxin, partial [Acephala macrosclerotiorum]